MIKIVPEATRVYIASKTTQTKVCVTPGLSRGQLTLAPFLYIQGPKHLFSWERKPALRLNSLLPVNGIVNRPQAVQCEHLLTILTTTYTVSHLVCYYYHFLSQKHSHI